MLPSLNLVRKSVLKSEIRLDLVRTAIQIERFRLQHENYPSSLEELKPRYLDQIPSDRFSKNNQTLTYYRTSAGFMLYSLGPNRTDDNGMTYEDGRECDDILFFVGYDVE